MEKFAVRLRWWLYSMVNVLNTIKMCTIKWLILCYMNFSSVKIVRKVKKEFPLPNAIVPAVLLFMVGLTILTATSLQPPFPPGSITHNPVFVWSIEKVASRPPFLSYFVFPVRRGVPSQIGGVGEKSKLPHVFVLRSSVDLLSSSGFMLLSVLLHTLLVNRGTWDPSSAFQSHLLPCQLLLASLLVIRSKCTSPFVFMFSSAGIHWPHFSGKGFSLGNMLPASSSTLKFSVFSNNHRKVTWSYLCNKKCSYWFLLHQFAF